MPSFRDLFDSSFNADSAVIAHFKNVSIQMGYNVPPPEPLVNQLGYAFLQRKMFPKSYSFFQMNIQNYPNSFNVFDSMGDYYEARGDKPKAIQYFTKALSLKYSPDTKKKLEKLKAAK
jgi:tetratricopeptide (TPR) repeat protein